MSDSRRAQMQAYIDAYLRGESIAGEDYSEFWRLLVDPGLKVMFFEQAGEEFHRRDAERERLKTLWLNTSEADEYRKALEQMVDDPKERSLFLNYIAEVGAEHVEAKQRIPAGVDLTIRSLLSGPKADLNTLLAFGEIVGALEKEREQP